MQICKYIKRVYCSDKNHHLMDMLFMFGAYLMLVDEFSFANIKFDLNLILAICYGRTLHGIFDYFIFQKYCRKYTITDKLLTFGTIGLLIFAALFSINYTNTRQQTIQTHIKNIQANEIKIDISKYISENNKISIWQIDIHHNKIRLKDKKNKKSYELILKNTDEFLSILKNIKTIQSNWDNHFYGKNSWFIELSTDTNYVSFTKNFMFITVEDEEKQEIVKKLLKFIDNNLEKFKIKALEIRDN